MFIAKSRDIMKCQLVDKELLETAWHVISYKLLQQYRSRNSYHLSLNNNLEFSKGNSFHRAPVLLGCSNGNIMLWFLASKGQRGNIPGLAMIPTQVRIKDVLF